MSVRRLLSLVFQHGFAWWRGRRLRLLLLGLPALLCGLGMGAVAMAAALTPTQDLETRYQIQAENALKTKDYPRALTCYDRLAYRSSQRPELLYGMAKAYEGLGRQDRTRTLMDELAPSDRTGYGPAHVWQAHRLLRLPNQSAERRQEAEAHLLAALDTPEEGENASVHGLLCELYLLDGHLEEAEAHLLKAVKSQPHLRLRAAQLYALRGDKQRARSECELAVASFRASVKADRTNLYARLGWADATTFLERFAEAVAILDEGFALSRDPTYPVAAARVYAAWYDTLARDSDSDMAARLALLEKGLQRDAGNQALLERLLVAMTLTGDDGERARAALRGLLAKGKAPAAVHFALGVDALRHGHPDQARVHWERALELAPHLPMVANNLAWMLANEDKPDLPRALELVNVALERAPNDLNFRHTRGHILFKMGRYKEALGDLEAALPRFPDSPELHARLADVYEHLGVPAMATEHRRLADAKPTSKPNTPAPLKH